MYQYLSEISFLGNTLLRYVYALEIFIAGAILARVFEIVIVKALYKFSQKTKTTADDFIVQSITTIAVPWLYLAILFLASQALSIGDPIQKALNAVALAITLFYVARFIGNLLTYSLSTYLRKKGSSEATQNSMQGMLRVIKVVIWGLMIVAFLDNLGFKISAVIAGLGIGGIAVALAAQAMLGDLFSYFAILFDRPFEIGDFVIIGEYMGVVQHVGIKTTRISSLGGEQIIFSNSDMTNSRVRNYKRMEKRRVVFKLGVTYQTPLEKIKEIPRVIENVIKSVDGTVFDRAHFFSYGDFSLIFEIVYYVMSGDYNKYMDIQQEINFAISEEFTKRDIEFAYPTQTLHINKP